MWPATTKKGERQSQVNCLSNKENPLLSGMSKEGRTNEKKQNATCEQYELATPSKGLELRKKIKCYLAQRAPTLAILVNLGVWNTILGVITILIASATYCTSNEDLVHKNDSKRYIPKHKQWRSIKWMKNMISQMVQLTARKFENWLDSQGESTKRNLKIRKMRTTASRLRCTTRVKKKTFTIMAALAMAAKTELRTGQHIATFDTDSELIGVDNRCTACISHEASDFITELVPTKRTIKGFGGTRTANVMTGTLLWRWSDDDGKTHKFKIPNSYYVPEGKCRLLSPQHWAKHQNDKDPKGTGEFTNGKTCKLYWNGATHSLTIPLAASTNVANIHMAPGYQKYALYCKQAEIADNATGDKSILIAHSAEIEILQQRTSSEPEVSRVGSDRDCWRPDWDDPTMCNFDLDGPEVMHQHRDKQVQKVETMQKHTQDMLKLHHRMGHIPFRKIQLLAKEGAVSKDLATCDIPVCSSCLYARMTRRPWRGKTSQVENHSTKTLEPGEVVSVDQLVSPTPGFIAQMTGILTGSRYKYATVFVDQASRLGYVYLQKTATAEETLKAKMAFELHARESGIAVKGYHADNGIFKANAWINHCNLRNQAMTYAGVNAHHQNGIAERRIRELQDMARTMLIHAANRWPDCITAHLWPYALRMANDALNNCPSLQDRRRRSPIQIFTNSKVAMNPKHFQTFGCPVYVLDNALQQNAPFHKWKERSRVGIYLGKSPNHGRNVALVLNRQTGLVSPQFHVKFDPSFHSVMQETHESKWQEKAGFKNEKETKKKVTFNKVDADSKPHHKKRKHAQHEIPDIPQNEGGMLDPEGGTRTLSKNGEEAPEQDEAGRKRDLTTNKKLEEAAAQNRRTNRQPKTRKRLKTQKVAGQVSEADLKTSGRSDSGVAPTSGSINDVLIPQRITDEKPIDSMLAMSIELNECTKNGIQGELLCFEALFPNGKDAYELMTMEDNPLLAYKATSDPDTMYHHEAMREPDREHFKQAMIKEVKDQMDNGNFTIVHKSEVPKGKTILPAVWQMKRKRDIKTRQVKKYKARLNIDGSRMQKGIHYDQTYAPVASWKSIRLLLIMVAKYGWHSKQLDYVLAFPQAPVEKEIYMNIPKGFTLKGMPDSNEYVLKLHRNVYGQKQAGRVWNQYLVDKLINELHFKQSKIDECVFYRGKTLYVLYTDDSLLAGPDKSEIDQIVKDLKKAKLNITDEGDIQDFLGVNISMKEDGTIHLTQPHLVDQVVEDLGLMQDNVKFKTTPAKSSEVLKRDANGKDFDRSFNYRSVVGKLNYLEKATRSDIAYITHQCARFTESPKESHAKALRWLGKYLKGTRDKGLILKPSDNDGIEVFVDADFSGNWDPKTPHKDRDTARSRHGYIVSYEGCPLLWKSQLQGEIALSSTESEYIGISYALREVIPVMELLKEMKKLKFPILSTKPKLHCKIFEDNSGALEMAKTHKYRPRTKHLNVKLHHFRDYVTRGEISIHKIDTKEQRADYLTKPVNQETLEHLRPKVMGW